MAVGTLKSNAVGIRPYGGARTFAGQEAGSTQNWITGAALILSSGQLAEASADPTSGLVGFAAHAASGTQGTAVLYWPALLGAVFEGTLEDQSNEDHVSVIANFGGKYALQTDTPGNWYLDENDTGNGVAVIIGFRDAVGSTRARVYFSLDVSATIFA